MNCRIIVVALVRHGNSFLLGKKATGKGPYPDTWHLPGGGVELGRETCEEALIRELREEANIEVKNLKKAVWDTDVEPNKHGEPTYYVFLQYTCDYSSGKLKAGSDMCALEWVPIKELKKCNLNKPTKIFLKKIGLL